MAIGKVSLQGMFLEDVQFTWNLSGTIDPINDIGKAVTLDTSAANTMKLAGAGDRIYGKLQQIEARAIEGITVRTVSMQFIDIMPFKVGETFAVGDTAVGGGSGTVEVLKVSSVSAPDPNQNTVVEVLSDGTPVVMKLT